ncbi:MAG: membrane protein insertion efficiency factor YidD [Nanoarchaeota archaeon]
MRKSNICVKLSIYIIKKVWHGKIGNYYKKKMSIICRFYPSCSNYGIIALEKYGFFKGWYKTLFRIKRCHPNNFDSCVDYP